MSKSIQQFNESLEDVRGAQADMKKNIADNAQTVQQLSLSLQTSGGSNEEDKVAIQRLKDGISELQASSVRYETKLQDFNTAMAGQNERASLDLDAVMKVQLDLKADTDVIKQSEESKMQQI